MENVDTAYALGQAAFGEGLRSSDNPYEADDPRCAAWDAGWESQAQFRSTGGMGFLKNGEHDEGSTAD